MIKKVEGDILLSDAQVIVHGVAANGPMNQGLAKALHEKYPVMHKDFHHWCHQHHPKPGSAWLWAGLDGKRIVNLITQNGGYGHGAHPEKATLANVKHALKALHKMAVKEKFESMALPRLATGVGGLEWDDIEPLIENNLGDLDIPVYIYEVFRPGIKGDEKG